MKDILTKLEESYKNSLDAFNELNSKFNDDNYDEDFENTLTRKYEEGYSDALLMAIKLLEKGE